MRTAKDGKQFDVDYCGEPKEGEVEVIQFLRPNGRRRRMLANVGKEHAAMAEGLVLSAEELTTGEVALYARRIDENEEKEVTEIAENGPGPNNPTECLKRLIEKKGEKKGGGNGK